MPILSIHLRIQLESSAPVAAVLMIQPQSGAAQTILKNELFLPVGTTTHEYFDLFGNHCLRVMLPGGAMQIDHYLEASVGGYIDVDPTAAFCPMEELPDEVLHYTLPSRYCESDELEPTALEIAGGDLPAYGQVHRIWKWIHQHFVYQHGSSDSHTSAKDAILARKGVCRDFAHVGIALTRSLNIPARMVVGYLDGLDPMDLHAWFEAFAGGRWYTFDATQREPKGGRVVVAYGRDAADVAIATHFSALDMTCLSVEVSH